MKSGNSVTSYTLRSGENPAEWFIRGMYSYFIEDLDTMARFYFELGVTTLHINRIYNKGLN